MGGERLLVGREAAAGAVGVHHRQAGAILALRDQIQRKAREPHLHKVAELARKYQYQRVKLYMMVGLPGETDDDIDELSRFATELSAIHPLALGIAPFVSKHNTPLDGQPFAGVKVVEQRLARLRRGLRGRVDVRATSARWAWVEYVLAQGGPAQGRAVLEAVHAGGSFADYARAFEAAASAGERAASRRLPLLAGRGRQRIERVETAKAPKTPRTESLVVWRLRRLGGSTLFDARAATS